MTRFGQDRQRRILFNWDGSDVLAFLVHQEFEGVRFHPPPEWLRAGTNTVQVLLLPCEVRPRGQHNDLPPVFVTRVELYTSFKGDGKREVPTHA